MATPSEGLRVARLLMVLSSISPLFVLWAIRGSKLLTDYYLLPFCALMVLGSDSPISYRTVKNGRPCFGRASGYFMTSRPRKQEI